MSQISVNNDLGGIEGLCSIAPTVHGDARGYFMETYNARELQDAGIAALFVQDNQSLSVKGVLRGLHYQLRYPQSKLVRVVHGLVYDVAVDLRPGSPSYGKWYGVYLSAENKRMLYIPRGFAHGFLVLSDYAEFCYKVDDYWHPNDEAGIIWNDPTIHVEWPQVICQDGVWMLQDGTELVFSEKDRQWPSLQELG